MLSNIIASLRVEFTHFLTYCLSWGIFAKFCYCVEVLCRVSYCIVWLWPNDLQQYSTVQNIACSKSKLGRDQKMSMPANSYVSLHSMLIKANDLSGKKHWNEFKARAALGLILIFLTQCLWDHHKFKIPYKHDALPTGNNVFLCEIRIPVNCKNCSIGK